MNKDRNALELPAGTPVEVMVRYTGNWVRGFEIAEHGPAGVRLRRVSDGAVLAGDVTPGEVRPAGAGA
jgi:hypothetical protein